MRGVLTISVWLIVLFTVTVTLADVVNAARIHPSMPLLLSIISLGSLMAYYQRTRTLLRRHSPKGFLQQDYTLHLTFFILLAVGMQTTRFVYLAVQDDPIFVLTALPYNVIFSSLLLFLTFIEGRFTHYQKRFTQSIRFNTAFAFLHKRDDEPLTLTQGSDGERHSHNTQTSESSEEETAQVREHAQTQNTAYDVRQTVPSNPSLI